MKRIEITDVTGRVWLSDTDEEGDAALRENEDEVCEMFRDFPSLNHISVVIDGTKRFFNPANIISAAIVDTATESEPR